jgi:hypothetical protein
MLASEVFSSIRDYDYLNAMRSGTVAILQEENPNIHIIMFDDFPYRQIAELDRTVSQDLLDTLLDRGCKCLSYGNAAKAGTGEGSSNIVIRF